MNKTQLIPCKQNLEKGGIISKLFFYYMVKVLKLGNTKIVEEEDMFPLLEKEKMERISSLFNQYYEKKKAKNWSLLWIFFSHVKWMFVAQAILWTVYELNNLIFLFSVKNLVNWFGGDDKGGAEAYKIAFIIAITLLINPFFISHGFIIAERIKTILFYSLFGLYFSKFKTISLRVQSGMDISKILNTVSGNIVKIYTVIVFAAFFFITPFLLTITIFLLHRKIGSIAFMGIALLFAICFIQYMLSKQINPIAKRKIVKADQRNNYIKNAISGIKTIKFNNWENTVYERINELRKSEKHDSFLITFLVMLLQGIFVNVGLVCSAFCIMLYMIQEDQNKEIGTIFFIIFMFNILQLNLNSFFYLISNLQETLVIFNNIEDTLCLPDENENILENDEDLNVGEVKVENASFSYDSEDFQKLLNKLRKEPISKPIVSVLTNISFDVKPGEFVAVIGRDGRGGRSIA